MPETRGEWFLFLVGVLIIGGLAGFIVVKHKDSARASGAPAARAVVGSQNSSPSIADSDPSGTASSSKSPSSTPIQLRVTATNDTWLSVRRDSSTGSVLFEGTLATGDTKSFSARRIWVRFGAAADLTASLNGRVLALPGGTYSAEISRTGLGARSA